MNELDFDEDLTVKKQLNSNSNYLNIAHINVRSYYRNRTAIEELIMSKEYDILVLTET